MRRPTGRHENLVDAAGCARNPSGPHSVYADSFVGSERPRTPAIMPGSFAAKGGGPWLSEVGFERRVIAEPCIAPGMVVEAADCVQLG